MSRYLAGRRRPDDTNFWELRSGEYCKRNGNWWVACPGEYHGGQITGNTGVRKDGTPEPNWEVVEHENGTITVTPSIRLTVGLVDGGEREIYHGYLTNGVWARC